eukprot:4557624-Amphidinium_carterae.1
MKNFKAFESCGHVHWSCESILAETVLCLQMISASLDPDRCNTYITESKGGLPRPQLVGRANWGAGDLRISSPSHAVTCGR